MADGKSSKPYARGLIAETITGNCGYPLRRRRSTADNARSTILKINQQDIEIDNSGLFLILQSYQRLSMRTSMLNLAILLNL